MYFPVQLFWPFAILLLTMTSGCRIHGPDAIEREMFQTACQDPKIVGGKRISVLAHDAAEYVRTTVTEEVDRQTQEVLLHHVTRYYCPKGLAGTYTCRSISNPPPSRFEFVETSRFLAQRSGQELEAKVFTSSQYAFDHQSGKVLASSVSVSIVDGYSLFETWMMVPRSSPEGETCGQRLFPSEVFF
jgi:hypothetical protein